MQELDDDFLEDQSTQFPAFPVVFRQEQQHSPQDAAPAQSKQLKLPDQDIKELLGLLDRKHETVYPQYFKQSWQGSSIDHFFQIYRPLNETFIAEMKAIKEKLNIVRISTHKLYVGQFLDSKCNGLSVVIFKNGNAYEGLMKDNKREGKGIYVHSGVGYFEGTFANDLKTEVGVEVIYKKWAYRGSFLNGLRHEKGLFVDKINDVIYFGQWKLGIMHGKGTLRTPHSTFHGTLVNSLKHGNGEERFTNGDVYRGDYQNNRFDGFGTYVWRGGATYEGSFKNGLRHGKGKWGSGETKYSGNYAEGLKEGYGELYLPSGNFYKGNFVEDKREGYGEMFWTDGSFYKGDWKGGVQNGKGQIYLVGGEVVSGLFQNSILVQVTPSIYEKQMEISSMGIQDLFGSTAQIHQPTKMRTLSQAKNMPGMKRKLAKIEEGSKRNSGIKDKMYFKSPQKNEQTVSHHQHGSTHAHSGFPSFTNVRTPNHASHQASMHDHSHGRSGEGHECKCQKRLQNFRLRHRLKTKFNDSKVVDQSINDDN